MARIVRALAGYPDIPANHPILVWDDMAIIEPAFAWLVELATIPGRSHAVETIRTYSEHLHEWFDSLEQSAMDWRKVSETEIAIWRNRMLAQPSPHTKRPYARSTINDRVRTISRFYTWAHERGWIEVLPFHFIDVRVTRRRPSFLAHVDTSPGVVAANVLMLAEHERLPRALRVDQLRRFFERLKMPYRLIAQWALTTGMRRKELCALDVLQVPETTHLDADEHPLMGVTLTITKGGAPRTSYPPIQLIDRTHRYIHEERGPLVRQLRAKRADYRAPSALFLNRHGHAISKTQLTRVFSEAFREAGVEGTGHWLRHTFAMTMLVKLQQQARETPDINPLKIVQVLLGHSSIQSTSIYLRCVEMNTREVSDSIAWLYGALVGDGR
jgi:integrase/recombinase XerD